MGSASGGLVLVDLGLENSLRLSLTAGVDSGKKLLVLVACPVNGWNMQ